MLGLLSFSGVMHTVGSVCLALVILLAMVTVHEFGHYAAGKLLKFRINEFAVGFGPALFKRKKKNGELFSVRLLPLGGYCAFEGEDEENPSPDAFNNKAPWKRMLVLAAGPLMNYVLALLLVVVSLFSFGQLQIMATRVSADSLTQSGIVVPAGFSLQDGDILLSCEGKTVYMTTDLMEALEGKREGDLADFTVSRRVGEGREVTEVSVMLRADAQFENLTDTAPLWRALGIAEEQREGGTAFYVNSVSYKFGFFETLSRSFGYSFRIGGTIFKVLGQLFTGHLGLDAFGGPITTIRLTSEIASRSAQQFFEIAAYIGVNLAVFNLLPIPALDGSKIVFCAIEWVRGKPLNRKVEAVIHAVGFVLLIGFAVLVDVLQLF